MKIKIEDGRTSFYQWDLDRRLCLEGAEPGMIVQFCKGDGTAYSVNTFEENGEIFANVPNAWLQNSGIYPVYVYCENNHTTCKHTMFIQPRPKPDEYIYTETEVLSYKALDERVKALEESSGGTVDLTGVVKSVNGQTPDKNGNVEIKIPEGGNGSGMTTAQINALDGLFKIAAYTENASGAYAAFLSAFGLTGGGEEPDVPDVPDVPDEPDVPEKTLTSISVVYSGGSVAAGTAVSELTGIVVTANYSDGTSETVTGYTLSGTIAEGSNTVTVSYGGKTATFTVTGIADQTLTVWDGEKIITDNDITGSTGEQFNLGMPYGLVTDRKITLEAGTYYLYSIYKTTSGIACQLWVEGDDGKLTDNTSNATTAKSGAFLSGAIDAFGNEAKAFYQPNGMGYLVQTTITLSESFTGYIRIGTGGQCYAKTEPDWTFLTTTQFNPFKQTLV